MLTLKQLIQKAKVGNNSASLIKIKGDKSVINAMLEEKTLVNKNYLNNSTIEEGTKESTLSMIIPDGDKFSADFLKKKIENYVKERANLYPNCAIIFSYAVYPDDALDEVELIKKIEDSFQTIRNLEG